MRKIVWVYLLGLICLNSGWAIEVDEDQLNDEATLERSVDPDENDSHKFSNLVKSTMDLMGPETEPAQKAVVSPETISQVPTP